MGKIDFAQRFFKETLNEVKDPTGWVPGGICAKLKMWLDNEKREGRLTLEEASGVRLAIEEILVDWPFAVIVSGEDGKDKVLGTYFVPDPANPECYSAAKNIYWEASSRRGGMAAVKAAMWDPKHKVFGGYAAMRYDALAFGLRVTSGGLAG